MATQSNNKNKIKGNTDDFEQILKEIESNFTEDEKAACEDRIIKPFCINVYVGYGWDSHRNSDIDKKLECKNALEDKYWKFWRSHLVSFAKKIETHFKKQKLDIAICVKRLRATHSQFVFQSIKEKIEDADVLIFDISGNLDYGLGFNSNVLLELGVALGINKEPFVICNNKLKSENLKKIKPQEIACPRFPSDLNGFTVSYYTADESKGQWSAKFEEFQAFFTKLRGSIINAINRKYADFLKSKLK